MFIPLADRYEYTASVVPLSGVDTPGQGKDCRSPVESPPIRKRRMFLHAMAARAQCSEPVFPLLLSTQAAFQGWLHALAQRPESLSRPRNDLLCHQPVTRLRKVGASDDGRLNRGHITSDFDYRPARAIGFSIPSSVMEAAFAITSAQLIASARPLTSSNPSDCFTLCSFICQSG
jgi:hypothetical protein